jgi:membrane-bound lytic murein transglycosylase D
MRYTGKIFLRVDYLIDERLDPIASSIAAAKLLQSNYKRLGTWPLAITAYNHGVNGMERAVEQCGTTDFGQILEEHKGRSFKFASKNFYAEFLAASEVAARYMKYFGDVEFHPPLQFQEITLDRYYDAHVLAKALGTSVETLQEYNLALRPALFVRQRKIPKNYKIKVPADLKVDPETVLAGVSKEDASPKEEPPEYYRIQKGESISSIADLFSVSMQELLDVNGLDRRSKIFAGQVLVIPQKHGTPAVLAQRSMPAVQLPERQKEPLPQKTRQIKPKREEEKQVAAPAETAAVLVYEPWIKIKLPALLAENPDLAQRKKTYSAESSSLAVGIYGPALGTADTTTIFNEGNYDLAVNSVRDEKQGVIRVCLDETLSHYADWLLIPYRTILEMNGMSKRKQSISLGQKLTVSFSKRPLEEFNRIRLEYHMAIEEDFYGSYRVKETIEHTVRRGENVWSLSDPENGPPLWLIQKYNPNIQFASLQPGQKIIVPEIEAIE